MPAVVGVVAVVASLVTFAGMLMTYPALWRSVSHDWRRIPPERKPRAIRRGAAMLAFVLVVAVLVIVAPWGYSNPDLRHPYRGRRADGRGTRRGRAPGSPGHAAGEAAASGPQ